jgi:hypothetical protein
MYAVLASADVVLGSDYCKTGELRSLSRRLGYRRGRCTPAHAALRNSFRRYLRTYGLVYKDEVGPANALPDLRRLVESKDTSHPLVSVRLGFTAAADAGTEIVGKPTDEDHLLVMLEINGNVVHYFDPTARPDIHSEAGMAEKAPLDVFLRFWAENPPEPYLRGWIEKVEPQPVESKVKVKGPRHTLETYLDRREGS